MKEGRLYLNADYVKMIWMSLAEHAVYPQDREQCFRWFAEVMKHKILIGVFKYKIIFIDQR